MKTAVITNYNIPEKANAALLVIDKLNELGCEVLVAGFNREKIYRLHRGKRDFINFVMLDKIYQTADLIILLGGDGTILEAARRAAPAKIPMLGFNFGRLGYMAELEINEIGRLAEVVSGNYRLDERMMLNVEVVSPSGNVKFKSFALNDAVISNGTVARIIDLKLSEGENEVTSYRADGLIISTPTGSTAYSMSAGGAIVDPRLSCFCVTPICPHSLTSRPLVFPGTALLDIRNCCQREKVLFLTLDGKTNQEISFGDTVRITKSDLTARLIRLKNNGFYKKLRQKMNSNI